MRTKRATILLVIVLAIALVVMLSACGNKGETEPSHVHSYDDGIVTTEATYNADGVKTYTCSCGSTRTEKIDSLIPTSTVVADGIATSKNATTQNYDFDITLTGNVSIMGFSGSASGVYSGKYRYDQTTGALKFMRETSGKLLFDAREYIYNKGDSRVTINTDTSDNIKKIAVVQNEDELNMLNKPFISIVQALESRNIGTVTKNASGKYRFKAAMSFASDSLPVRLLLNKVAKMGSSLSIKDVNFNNPQGGVDLDFNVTDAGVLADFTYSFHVDFPVAGQRVTVTITYAQRANNNDFTVPNLEGYLTSASAIGSEVTAINSAITAVRNSATYSVDMSAVNDFDAGWNKLAVVDKYIARIYKNTNDDRIDFNHSYYYKSHTEEDGSEAFKYTIGNVVEDNKVYEISRRGSNTQTELNGVSANDRFDLLMAFASLESDSIDFLKKSTDANGITTYKVFFKNNLTISLQKDIIALLNSNTSDGVVPVENYLDEDAFEIVSGEYTIAIKDGKLLTCNLDVELRYTPTDGDYSDRIVTLKNSVGIKINEKLDKASEYVAPNQVNTRLLSLGLNNSKYYIL